MNIGILTRNPDAWCSQQLQLASIKLGHKPICINFPKMVAKIGLNPILEFSGIDILKELSAIIVRPIGRGSLDECIFRMDILHRLIRNGFIVINHPSAIEKCIDKFYAISLLQENGIPIPKTIVTENSEEALKAFYELGEDIVIKPLFGSRGIGITRVTNSEIAIRIFRTLQFMNNVLYIQEFIPHGKRDIRAFVIGDKVVASMYREAESWKTNVAQGAKPKSTELPNEIEEIVLKAAKIVGCEIAGIDILEGENGPVINEINSQPGFRGLQSVTKINIAEEIIKYVIEKIKK